MLPSTTPSTFFEADQEWMFRVRTWDTPHTALEAEVASEGMHLRVYQPKSDSVNWMAYKDAVKNASNPDTAFVNATYADSTIKVAGAASAGRWPLVQSYWGSGAPNWWGASYTSQVALCFKGSFVPAAQRAWLSASNDYTFALAGSGYVRIDVVRNNVRQTLFSQDLRETTYLTNGFVYSDTRTFAVGDELSVYYVQTRNDPWGGLVIKAIPGARPSDASSLGPIASAAAAEAPVLSCGLFSYGSAISAVELPFVTSINVSQADGSASKADIEIPLVNPQVNDGSGWVFSQGDPYTDPGVLKVYDGGTLVHTLERKRLLQIQVARRSGTPAWMCIFTGQVDDFGSGSNGRLTIQASSFEARLVEQYEQAPDRISYMARGYRVLDYKQTVPSKRIEPVYNVPAFDNWPLAWAIEELAMRAGLDPSRFRKPWRAVKQDGSGETVTLPWGSGQLFSARALSGSMLRLPRAAHYGNVGLSFTELRPFDDPYLFKIEPTKDLWARVRELAEKLGYICRFNNEGAAVLYPASSPAFVRDLSVADATAGSSNITAVVNPSAYGAKYLQVASGQTATITVQVKASRIDVSFPRVADARNWMVSVVPTAGGTPVTKTVVPASTNTDIYLFFNSTVTAPGSNATVQTIYTGTYQTYTVTLTPAAGTGLAYVDCLLCYAQDPDRTLLPTLSTGDNAISVTTRPQQDAVRNKVTIVGRRKAAVTDSDKFAEAQAPTEQEFVVQNAVDVLSIVHPEAKNYVGYLKQSVIYDDSIADDGLARYLAQVFIYRQRNPQVSTAVQHTLLPMLELGDPVAIEEPKFQTVDQDTAQYVRRISHQISRNKFLTSIDTEPWPDFPAYQPRTDIDIKNDFDNKPVTNMAVDYVSLSGHTVSNPTASLVKEVVGNSVIADSVLFTGSTLNVPGNLPWPPAPGTFQVKLAPKVDMTKPPQMMYVTTTMLRMPAGQRLTTIQLEDDWAIAAVNVKIFYTQPDAYADTNVKLVAGTPLGSATRADHFYYELIDGFLVVFRGSKPFVGDLNTGTFLSYCRIEVNYRVIAATSTPGWLSNNPYHQFVSVNYQDNASPRVTLPWKQLNTSGLSTSDAYSMAIRYRSLFPANGGDPNGSAINGVSFSPFYDPYTSELGNLISFRFSVLAEGLYRVSVRNWDDDTVVAWLTNPASDASKPEQHWEYLPILANKQFTWDGVDQLGLWNASQSELYSELVEGTFETGERPRIGGGFYAWNRELAGGDLGPLAYVWMQRNSDGTPIIGHGTYARWYIHIEAETTTEAETVVQTKSYRNPGDAAGTDRNLAILTHLPEPTKLQLSVRDWNGSAWVFPQSNSDITAITGYINNTKPVRLQFKVARRPGALWTAGNEGEVEVKLTREVHLRAVIGDQAVVFSGKEFGGSTVEDRTIYNRRLVNDEHTKRYSDSGYRKAKTFKWGDTAIGEAVTDWEFRPSDFKKDFLINGYEQSIEFGNYLQLEEVPSWNGARAVTAARSRLHFALMSYLFYLSAYVTDRSGRSNWGLNTEFVDKSKIYGNETPTTWSLDPMYEHRRTIVCRQWTKEDSWVNSQLTAFGLTSDTLFAKLLESFWHQHDITATTIGAQTPVSWSAFGLPNDDYTRNHAVSGTSIYNEWRLPSAYAGSSRQLGGLIGTTPVTYLGKKVDGTVLSSSWSWESTPLWIPSITRDLHPFFLLPPMVSPPTRTGKNPTPGFERDYRTVNCFWTIGGDTSKVPTRTKGNEKITGSASTPDAAGAETWCSVVYDYVTGPKRFWPGTVVDTTKDPTKLGSSMAELPSNVLNYVRQDEMVHYEDLRGIFSRGKYPVAQPIKVAPVAPYYINMFRYAYGIERAETLAWTSYPQFHVIVDRNNPGTSINMFRIAFRNEYLWESGSMFPTDRYGRERLEGVLWWRHRFVGFANSIFYDYGAWTGWKDDLISGSTLPIGGWRVSGDYEDDPIVTGNPFATKAMPVAVGPTLSQTAELVSHLVLLPERRGS